MSKEKEEKDIFYQWGNIIYLILVYKILHWYKKKKAGAMVNVCALSKFVYWNITPQCRGISRWNLSEVIRIRWDNVGGALLSGICALTRVMRELVSPLCSPPGEDITRICQSITWKRALTGTNHDGTLIWNLQHLWKKLVITLSGYGTLLQQPKLRAHSRYPRNTMSYTSLTKSISDILITNPAIFS